MSGTLGIRVCGACIEGVRGGNGQEVASEAKGFRSEVVIGESCCGSFWRCVLRCEIRVQNPHLARARAVLCYVGVRRLGLTSASIAKELRIRPSAVSKSIVRGQQTPGHEAIEEHLLENQ